MTTLKFEKISMPSAHLGPAGDYPVLFFPLIRPKKEIILDETEGLYLGYGAQAHALPYTTLGDYDRAEEPRDFEAFILENNFLKAVFIPSLGGRMWSLFDKKRGKDLVVDNPVFRPCNLAARNAWFSGGVEWNCGFPGHHPLTCDKVYGAQYAAEDGTPVLRLYAFERCRAVTYQMDFFLPNDSETLFARMRLVNGSDKVIPIYWWSTIAVEEKEGARIIVPADEAYYKHGVIAPIGKGPVPMRNGFDNTYPTNHIDSNDDFYKIPEDSRKYQAYIDAEGYGLIHSSTKRLKGRKLFVWGTGEGSKNWQKLLTNKEGEKQPYVEIQAGLCYTQQGSLPFPPCSALEWMEAYTPVEMAPEAVHCEYKTARRNVEAWLDEALPEARLDAMLKDTKKEALKEVPYTYKGHPWGTLDNELKTALGKRLISPNLCFGEIEEEQKLWLRFLKNGYLDEPSPEEAPISYMVQDEWFDLLKKTVRGSDRFNWYAWYNLALCYYARCEYELSSELFETSLRLKPSTWAYHGLACSLFNLNECEAGASSLAKALKMNCSNLSLAKEAVRLCDYFKQYNIARSIYEDSLSDECKRDPYVLGYYAAALAYTGSSAQTISILEQDGGLFIPDIREGDETITNAYIHAVQEQARSKGKIIEYRDVIVPLKIDFRMYKDSKKK